MPNQRQPSRRRRGKGFNLAEARHVVRPDLLAEIERQADLIDELTEDRNRLAAQLAGATVELARLQERCR